MFKLLQPIHLLFVLLIALVVLGPTRLAQTGRSLGRTIRSIQEYKEELLGMADTKADERRPEKERPDEKVAEKEKMENKERRGG